jgi:hypothetical protein
MRSRNYVFPTKEEQARERAARKLGCSLSRIRMAKGLPVPKQGPVEIDHLVKPGKRLGHAFSIPLHPWYHRGVVPYPLTSKPEARELYGAAVSDGSKAFLESHGVTRMELYVETQRLLGLPVETVPTKIMPRREALSEAQRVE